MKIRAVIDTNILVSGIISFHHLKSSPPVTVLQLLYERKIVLILSLPILSEIRDVLLRPKISQNYHLTKKEIKDIIISLHKISFVVPGRRQVSKIKEEPADNKFLSAAIEGKADYIVSGDKHLLNLREFRKIPIITGGKFTEIASRPIK